MKDLAERVAAMSPEERRRFAERVRGEAARRGLAAGAPAPADGSAPRAALLRDESFRAVEDGNASEDDIRRFYDTVTDQLDASPFAEHAMFLTYGYVPNDNPTAARVPLPAGTINRNTIRLVLELVGDHPIGPDHAALDVGCGRGGTLWVLRELFGVRDLTGIDLSPRAIASCRRRFGDARAASGERPAVRFEVGHAEALPFPAASFDVVTNVESSHGYPHVERFFAEVFRVLRPGGAFLYTDLLAPDHVVRAEAALAGLGFVKEREQDITSNVILSCDDTALRNAGAFAAGNDEGIMGRFLGAPDSATYGAMKSGARRYMLYRLARPAGAAR